MTVLHVFIDFEAKVMDTADDDRNCTYAKFVNAITGRGLMMENTN